jgi:dUTP pyrophosphatase
MGSLHVAIKAEEGAELPSYRTIGASGADLFAFLTQSVCLEPGQRKLIPTGLRLQLPVGFEAQIRPRSGLACDFGVTCLNSPGTIDSDYRGELKVLLVNLGNDDIIIKNGDRIAQLVIAPVVIAIFEPTVQLSDTIRGNAGFGSTGR